jgi:CRP-like cAMP-binding protein
MEIRDYNKDKVIHFDGDLCANVEIILSGQVIVERIDESGNLFTITEFFPDDILGGNLVFSKNPHYPMTVTAKTDSSLLVIQKELLFELCSSHTEFLKQYLEYISDHALLLGDKIKHYVNRSIRESLVAFLKNEYKLQRSNKIILHTSKKSLADRIGVQRTSLSRELQKMKNEGLIEFGAVSITVIDFNLL